MKHLIVACTLLSCSLWAQSPTLDIPTPSSPANGPSYSQMYCSGFVTRQPIPRTNFVVGSKESPHEDRIPGRALMFLGGPGLVEGQRYTLLRQIVDPNHEDSSPEQRWKLAELGALYQDVGWVTVHTVQQGAAIASFDFSCDPAIRGDIVVPFKEKFPVAFRTVDPPVSSFRPLAGTVNGHILGAQDFLGLLGTDQVIYTDFGAAKGARPGDYLLILRGYAPGDLNKIDRASQILPRGAEAEAAAHDPAHVKSEADDHLPAHVLGEGQVLSASPESSTVLITRSFAEMELGDVVVAEETHSAEATPPVGEVPPCSLISRLRHLVLHFHDCRAK